MRIASETELLAVHAKLFRGEADEAPGSRELQWFRYLTADPDFGAALGLCNEEVFWNRYYWFLRHISACATIGVRDAGLEQQAFQILEYPFPPCSPDWSHLEAVEKLAEQDASGNTS